MFKGLLTLLLLFFLSFSCSKKDKTEVISQPTEEENKDTDYLSSVAVNA